MKQHVIATETIHVATKDGVARTVYAGSPLEETDPIVKANRDRFKTPEEIADQVEIVHTATPAPKAEKAADPDPSGPITTASAKRGSKA